ncbi:D-alanyl-D-alanine carboxypeptidase [Oerskovia enterophila]|uniref:D-alanyl-D-alanine carboxypeptidase n=2 Tax=Oerskovia enterophila TaxID=43678 RepID=A0ABX2Y872_9CELL|nr:D-alanyl-D-alanine carboxypeptidase [Oerskovia enterophila]
MDAGMSDGHEERVDGEGADNAAPAPGEVASPNTERSPANPAPAVNPALAGLQARPPARARDLLGGAQGTNETPAPGAPSDGQGPAPRQSLLGRLGGSKVPAAGAGATSAAAGAAQAGGGAAKAAGAGATAGGAGKAAASAKGDPLMTAAQLGASKLSSATGGRVSQENADVAAGALGTAAHAAAGNVAGAVLTGAKTIAKDPRAKRIAVAAATLILLMLFMLLAPMTIGQANNSTSNESIHTNAAVAAEASGMAVEASDILRASTQGTSVPWPVLAAVYLTFTPDELTPATEDQSPTPPPDGLFRLGVDEARAAEAGIDPSDLSDTAAWVVQVMEDRPEGELPFEGVDLLAGSSLVVDPETGDATSTYDTDPDLDEAAQESRAAWLPALARLPMATPVDEQKAGLVYDLAVKLAGGIETQCTPTNTIVPVDTATEPADGEPDDAATGSTGSGLADADAKAKQDAENGAGAPVTIAPGTVPVVEGFDAEQVTNALEIIAVADEMSVPDQGIIIAFMAGMVESGMRDLDHGHSSSLGIFQLLSMHGTAEQRMDTAFSARWFFNVLLSHEGWEAKPLGEAAADVERPAAQYRDRYAMYEDQARMLAAALGRGSYIANPDAACPPAGGDFATGTPGSPDGLLNGGAWGGHSNGMIPATALSSIPWAPNQMLRSDATTALVAMNAAYRAEFGKDISITDAYRTYASQVRLKALKGHMAATPGKSNHGWGLALDLGGGINSWSTPQHAWMKAHAPSFGWVNPNWAQPGAGKEEPWHWEFVGVS